MSCNFVIVEGDTVSISKHENQTGQVVVGKMAFYQIEKTKYFGIFHLVANFKILVISCDNMKKNKKVEC